MTDRGQPDVAVVGAGPAGLSAAIALAREGFATVLVGAPSPSDDGRTVALLDGSVRFLAAIGAWDAIAADAAPLAVMRIIDDTGSLFRAPPLIFHAAEIGLDAFGFNVENVRLVTALTATAEATEGLTVISDTVADIAVGSAAAILGLGGGGRLSTSLVVGADGRASLVRRAAGIPAHTWSYPQAALTTILEHERPHHDTSSEFHTRAGPFTLVPLPGRRSSLVWVCAPAEADRLVGFDDAELASAVERRGQAILGSMHIAGPRGRVPMTGLSARSFTAPRTALVGEAAHVLPPIGAQGLNLGLRDAAALRDALVGARRGSRDAGSAAGLAAYERGRAFDAGLRTAVVDGLNRALLADIAPVDFLRGAGMVTLGLIGPLRRAVMREGLKPRFGTPRLMRADARHGGSVAF